MSFIENILYDNDGNILRNTHHSHKYFLYDDNGNTILKTYHSNVDAGPRKFFMHHHTECELSLFLEGSGIYSLNDKSYHFEKGDMFLFGSNEAHCITEISSRIELLNIQFEPRILWENHDNIELLGIFNMRNENFKNKFSKEDAVLKEYILGIEKEISLKNKGYTVQAKNLLYSAFVHILRNYDYVHEDDTRSSYGTTTQKLKRAMEYIQNNLENKMTLTEIADKAHMTNTYFSTIFKRLNGISPWDYITIKRVEKAIGLIKTTSMTKLEIAEKCGFSSSSNFYKAFYNITGKTPKEYKKKG